MKGFRSAALAAMPLLLCAGCISLVPGRRPPVARYAVEASGVGAKDVADASGRVFSVGRVKASEAAMGRGMRVVHAATGRVGLIGDGEFAQTSEAIVRSALIARLAALFPGAAVCDAAIAPREGRRIEVSAWIERFALTEKGGEWSFSIGGFVYAAENGRDVRSARLELSRKLPGGKMPGAEDVARTVSEMLSRDLDKPLSSLLAPGL